MRSVVQWGLGCLAWLLLPALVLFGGFLVAFPVITVMFDWPGWAWAAWGGTVAAGIILVPMLRLYFDLAPREGNL